MLLVARSVQRAVLFVTILMVLCHRLTQLPRELLCTIVAAAVDAPSINATASDNNDPRVAHCLVGEIRTMAHPMVHQNYEAHVLSKLGVASDVYFVLNNETNATEVFRPIATDAMVVESMYEQYLRWFRCLEMIAEHENASDVNYTHVIVSRADQLVLQDIPSIDAFPVRSIWVKPYGEIMDSFDPGYSHRDEDASLPAPFNFGVSDLFLVIPRPVATDYFDAIQTLTESKVNPKEQSCGEEMERSKLCGMSTPYPECTLKCAMHMKGIPVAFQTFQLRMLRPHQRGGCHFMKRQGQHYNSLCM